MSPSPMLQLDEAVSRPAFAAAPEKAEELFARVRHIKLEFRSLSLCVRARQEIKDDLPA